MRPKLCRCPSQSFFNVSVYFPRLFTFLDPQQSFITTFRIILASISCELAPRKRASVRVYSATSVLCGAAAIFFALRNLIEKWSSTSSHYMRRLYVTNDCRKNALKLAHRDLIGRHLVWHSIAERHNQNNNKRKQPKHDRYQCQQTRVAARMGTRISFSVGCSCCLLVIWRTVPDCRSLLESTRE